MVKTISDAEISTLLSRISETIVFFNLSRNIFFEQNKKLNHKEVHNWLVLFCKHCRMCERKLIVDSKDISTLSF